VFFPLEQILIYRGVDLELLKRKEKSLAFLLREIAKKKKELFIISLSNSPEIIGKKNDQINDNRINHENVNHRHKEYSKDNKNEIKKEHKTVNLNINHNENNDVQMKSKLNNIVSTNICCMKTRDYATENHMNTNIMKLEELSGILFTEILILKEQQNIAESARTQYGRVLRILGQLLTIVAIIRLFIGIYHVFYHLRKHLNIFSKMESKDIFENIGLDDIYSINTIRNSNIDQEMWTGLGVNFGVDGGSGAILTGRGYLYMCIYIRIYI
jgi:hypothetical protein